MSTIMWRPDYAKFLIECHPENWEALYGVVRNAAGQRKYPGEWDKSHKVNRLWYNAAKGMETWSIDIWGEWSGIIELLPVSWLTNLRRLDMRSIVWDADGDTVLAVGSHLLHNVTNWNIHLYNTKVAKKSEKRDRGGEGFAIGSHKSDLRITVYKRHGEPVAQEFQMKGPFLQKLCSEVMGDFASVEDLVNAWRVLGHAVTKAGELRMERVLEAAGVGVYWPLLGPQDIPALPPAQGAFLATLPDEEGYPDPSEPSHTA